MLTILLSLLLAAGVFAAAAVADEFDYWLWTNSTRFLYCLIQMVNIVVEAFVAQTLHCQPSYLLQPNVKRILH